MSVYVALTLVGTLLAPPGLDAQDTEGGDLVTLEGEVVSEGWMYQTSSHDIYSVRFLGGVEGFHRYGDRGSSGVLEIVTHHR